MKSKVIGVYVSLILMLIAGGLIIIFTLIATCVSNALLNIGYGILGSSVVTLVITFSEYFIEKRKGLESYLIAIYECLSCISKIQYTKTVEEKYFIAKFDYKSWFNSFNDSLSEEQIQPYKEYFISNGKVNKDISDTEFLNFMQEKIKVQREKMKTVMQTYIDFAEFSMEKVNESYANIYFLNFSINKKKRQNLYDTFLKKLNETHRKVEIQSRHFNDYIKAENGNMPVMLGKIEELNKLFFREEFEANRLTVWTDYTDGMFEECEKFRCEIYGIEYTPTKRHPKLLSIQNATLMPKEENNN